MTLEVLDATAALLDGRYVLKERVGRGGMATVYRAEDTHLERVVAIKMLHEGDGSETPADRAHNEKALLASVSHPSLVTLYDAQLEPNRPQYLVMEYVDGPTLAKRMAAGPIPERQVARFTRDIADGLAAVHAAGIVHRDIKPSNVLLTQAAVSGLRTAKLADFGIACTLGSSRMTRPGIVLGTFAYISPEQLRDADPGTPVDIFALGLVALEALTGEPGYPHLGAGRAAAAARLMNTPNIPESVPAGWRDLLSRMTALDPEERPTAVEVARAARELLRGGSGAVPSGGAAAGRAPGAGAATGGAVAGGAANVGATTGGTAAAGAAIGGAVAAGGPGGVASAEAAPGRSSTGSRATAATRVMTADAATGSELGGAVAGGGAGPEGAVAAGAARGAIRDAAMRAERGGRRRQGGMLAGAAAVVVAGVLTAGMVSASLPNPGATRVAVSPVERVPVAPAEVVATDTEPADTTPVAPIEVVSEQEDSGGPGNSANAEDAGNSGRSKNSGSSGNSGNSGKSENSGNSGKSGNSGNSGNSGKPPKPDKPDKSG